MRLIDADQIVYSWQIDADGQEHDGVTLQSIIAKMPTVDAVPVKHGHWYDVSNYLGTGRRMYVCSECGAGSSREDPYCWHCGAKMDVSDTDVGKMKEEE